DRYGVDGDRPVLLYAVGDGNHSLATAKAVWEGLKKTLPPERASGHPARQALVEIVNVHDEGLEFEPIHRVLFGVKRDLAAELTAANRARFSKCDRARLAEAVGGGATHRIGLISPGATGVLELMKPA